MTEDDRLAAILADHAGREGALLPILHDVQAAYGCVPADSYQPIADALRLSRAEVAGVVSFYHDFRDAPAGKHVIKLCRAEACQSMGGTEMIARLERALGMKVGETKGDVTLEAVYCLGLCACAPAAMVGDQLVGRATPERIEALVAEVSA
ncbi:MULTISPECIES: formate dehydrogenase subunit gamma [Thioclava]|uniref:Formate dehydrogenase subunit gamma n=1 Tax=Thioclava nitratireducens TaxID=1915078 RepID=A0ABM6IKZ5_9RHOB|nr:MULTISPECIES: formate dehydrogenase subunit gamma [Thioclava]AQS49381.1 formate dehydrogenase subunit gamma [Thioclava nitratireducens]OWY03305.1 formate dehydrogenase subunit gamma [Thioclava sp. IC9]OWY03608.1 formate dehydrogenase subunit gamma [Thioclava sp. F1Mire-8]OWY14417.1 formate dehydrogenase subunit gamma [Thioclava sp. F34-6]OWY16060.1 formate dehydrogenase subunit gamma [Thioclava sp. JM3]